MKFIVEERYDGVECGFYLRRVKSVSRRLVSKLKRTENGITRGGEILRTVDTVRAGDVIILEEPDDTLLEPSDGLFAKAVFEDENVVVFDKPVDMPVHPSARHRNDTLGNYFAKNYPGLTFRPINRLDIDPSGLCAVAKNRYAAAVLQEKIEKVYYAVVCGKLEHSGTIDLPISRAGESIIRREVREDGQRAVTHYEPILSDGRYTLLKIHLETGRTHQIRVHFSHIGYPLAGDDFYGGDISDTKIQALHCGEMIFIPPQKQTPVCVVSEIPKRFYELIAK